MSDVVNPNAATAAARSAMVKVPDPMVSATSSGTPQATSGSTAGSTGIQDNVQTAGTAAGLPGGQAQGNVQTDLAAGTANAFQGFFCGAPQANLSATGVNPNLVNQFPMNDMQTSTPMTQQSIATPTQLLQPPIMGGISVQDS